MGVCVWVWIKYKIHFILQAKYFFLASVLSTGKNILSFYWNICYASKQKNINCRTYSVKIILLIINCQRSFKWKEKSSASQSNSCTTLFQDSRITIVTVMFSKRNSEQKWPSKISSCISAMSWKAESRAYQEHSGCPWVPHTASPETSLQV